MNPMMQLMARNSRRGQFRAEADPAGAADTLYLYDMIVDTDAEAEWWGGVSPQAFNKALKAMTAPDIHLRVNSPGGSVFAARAMEQAIREHPSNIIAHVDGLAASAASVLIMAADTIEMSPGAFLMIHKAWTIAWGNADDLIQVAGTLEQVDASLVKTYAARTGQDPAEIAAWLAAETWLDADRAIELGFADQVAAETNAQTSARASAWDLTAYQHPPKAAAAPPPQEPAGPDRAALRRAALARLIPA